MKTAFLLISSLFTIIGFSQNKPAIDYDNAYKMVEIRNLTDSTVITEFECRSFMSMEGISGCYKADSDEYFVGGVWEKVNENELHIQGESEVFYYFIINWSLDEIIIVLQNMQGTHFVFRRTP